MPSIINATTTTGLVSSGDTSGSLQLATNNGTAAVTIDTSQNVGIGTASPVYKLDVNNASNYATIGLRQAGTLYGYVEGGSSIVKLGTNAAIPLSFEVNGAERARITSGGYFKASSDGIYTSPAGFHEVCQSADGPGFSIQSKSGSLSTYGVAYIETARNTTNNTYYALSYYNTGAGVYRLRVADSGAIATAGSIALGSISPPTSGIGISFPATQSASSDANTLDDYEEGTWTPSVTATGGGLTVSYSSRVGRYTKIGRVVFCEFDLTISAESGGSGEVYIGNLPFTKSNDSPGFAGDMCTIRGGRTTALAGVSATRVVFAFAGTVLSGQTNLELGYTNNSTGEAISYTVADLTTGRIVGSFQYCV